MDSFARARVIKAVHPIMDHQAFKDFVHSFMSNDMDTYDQLRIIEASSYIWEEEPESFKEYISRLTTSDMKGSLKSHIVSSFANVSKVNREVFMFEVSRMLTFATNDDIRVGIIDVLSRVPASEYTNRVNYARSLGFYGLKPREEGFIWRIRRVLENPVPTSAG